MKELFLDARDRPPSDREAYVRDACAREPDPSIAEEVLAQLAAETVAGVGGEAVPFMGAPAIRIDVSAHAPDAIPDRIGAYQILDKHRPLGQGGMGVVLLAEQDRPRRKVALKLVRPGHLTPQLLRRFEFEAEVLGRLDHPGIARVYEAGVVRTALGEQPFFAMELVEGVKLGEHLERTRPSRDDRLRLLVKIARAVQHAHGKGVVHRDLKPDNIMVDAAGEPKVLDFGVARVTDAGLAGETMQTQSGHLIGTPAYMSPEQAAGRANEVDTTSDVYALGVLAYEMFAGRLPYELEGKPLHEAVRAICEAEPGRLSSVDCSLRGDVETVVGKCLEKERSRRYGSAGELAEDVRRILEYEPIRARPATHWYNLQKFARRNKAIAVGVMVVILMFAVAAAVSTTFAIRSIRQRDLAVRARVDAELRAAEMSMQRADWRKALEIFDGAFAMAPTPSFEAKLNHAKCTFYVGDLAAAEREFDSIIAAERSPAERARGLLGKAGCLYASDTPRAIAMLREARPQLGGTSDIAMCDALLATSLTSAETALREVLRCDPYEYQAKTMLAVTLLARAQMPEAQVAATTLRELAPSDPFPALLLGVWAALRRDGAGLTVAVGYTDAAFPAECRLGARRLLGILLETAGGPNEPETPLLSTREADERMREIDAACSFLTLRHFPVLPRALVEVQSPMRSIIHASLVGDIDELKLASNALRATLDVSEVDYLAATNSEAQPGRPSYLKFDPAVVQKALEHPSWSGDKRMARMIKMAVLMSEKKESDEPFETAEADFSKLAAETMVEGGFTNAIDGGPISLVPALRAHGATLTAFLVARSWADNEPTNVDALRHVAEIQIELGQLEAATRTIRQLASLPTAAQNVLDQLRNQLEARRRPRSEDKDLIPKTP